MVHDLLGQAYGALQHDRRRSMLTMLGMAWGIATVVLLLSYGAGFQVAIENIFSNFGAKLIGIFPGRTSLQAGGAKAGVQVRLKLEDVDRITTGVPLVKHNSPMVWLNNANVQKDVRNFQWEVDGVTPAFQSIRNFDIVRGRFFNQEELLARSRVAVLSAVRNAPSRKNWVMMLRLVAPSALRSPISLVRSVTDTSMMLTMPMAPRARVTRPTLPRNRFMASKILPTVSWDLTVSQSNHASSMR